MVIKFPGNICCGPTSLGRFSKMERAVFMLWFGWKGFMNGRGPLGKDRTVNWGQEFGKCEVPELWQP